MFSMQTVLLLNFIGATFTEDLYINETEQETTTASSMRARALHSSRWNSYLRDSEILLLKDETCGQQNETSVVLLINYIAENYFNNCVPIILYDDFFYKNPIFQRILYELTQTFPLPVVHGYFSIDVVPRMKNKDLLKTYKNKCSSFIILSQTLENGADLIGIQTTNKVVLVSQSSQWQIYDFLKSRSSQQIVNLLVVADPTLQHEEYYKKVSSKTKNQDINIYTHILYSDGLGSTSLQLLTAWRCDRLTRPHVELFPRKIKTGFNGYRFTVAAAEHQPYVYLRRDMKNVDDSFDDRVTLWDGLEVRLLRLMGDVLNFTLVFKEPSWTDEESASRALKEMGLGKSDIAIAGIYASKQRFIDFQLSPVHSQDCAAFISLATIALPKYRAIFGPFRWEVWLALSMTYILAIFPIAFSAHHTWKYIFNKPSEIENMFWYVFGTFTNLFTFTGKKAWSNTRMSATRMFIGSYWVFSIIITAAYTGSIIAFIMLPSFPPVIDSPLQLLSGNFRIVTTNSSGWAILFNESSDPITERLLKNIEIVPTITDGLRNVSRSKFYRPYAFLGSSGLLKHVVKTNYTDDSKHKKSVFHLSRECFVPMMTTIAFPKDVIYSARLEHVLLQAMQSGFIEKINRDVEWETNRQSNGKFLQAGITSLKGSTPEERQLSLDDVQGSFMLLGIGFGLAFVALIAECISYLIKRCKYSDETSQTGSSISQPVSSAALTSFSNFYDNNMKLYTRSQRSKSLGDAEYQKCEDLLEAYFGSQVFKSYSSAADGQCVDDPVTLGQIYTSPNGKRLSVPHWVRRNSC